MAQFTSSPQVSSGPDPNSLFDASKVAEAGQTYQNNQLLMQGKQLDLSNANVEQVSRLAAGLINIQDPAARAEAYAKGVGLLQGMGFALHAPATLPDDQTLHMLATAGTPSTDLYKLNLGQGAANAAIAGLSPGATAASTATPPATTGTPTTGTAAPSGPAPFVGANLPAGVSPDEDQLVRTVYGEARGEPVAGQQAVASVIKTRMGLGKQGVQDVVFAPNQFEAWSDPKNRPGMEALSPTDPQYQAILNNVVRPVMSGQAQDPTGGATNFYNPQLQAQLGRSTPSFAQGNQTTIGNHTFFYGGYAPRGAATAAAQPAAAPAGGGGTPAPYQTASTAPTAPPGSTAAPAAAPAPDTPWDLPGAPAPDLPPPSTPTAAPAPAYQSPQNGLAPPPTAAAPPPPAPGVPPAVQPTAQPAAVPHLVSASGQAVPPPPGGVAVLSNGLTQQQWAAVQGELRTPGANIPQVLEKVSGLAAQNRTANLEAWKAANPALQSKESADGTILYNPNNGQVAGLIPHAAVPTTPRFNQGAAGVYNATTGQYERPTPATQSQAVQGSWAVNNIGQEQFYPAATTPAEGGYKNMETAYKRDSENITGIGAEGRTAQADQVRVQEMRNILKTTNTGSGAETQAAIQAFLQSWAPSMLTNWTTNYANLDGPAAIQMFQKLGFMGATSQEQQVTPRGGYLATKLFQQFNPGAQLLTATNNGLLAQRLIANQASIDYSQGAQNQFAQQEQNFTSSKPSYSSLAQYDRQWQAQRQPQVYAAAIGALGQQDYNQWSKNLSDAEIQRTLDVVHRADPSAVVNGKGGRLDLSQQNAATSPAVTATGPGGHKLVLQNGQWVPQ